MARDEVTPNADWITPSDHEAGFKDVLVVFRSGKEATVRIWGISPRKYLGINHAWKEMADRQEAATDDLYEMIARAALVAPDSKDGKVEIELAKLTPASYQAVIAAAHYLAIGYPDQKKITTAFSKLMENLGTRSSPSSDSKDSSSPPDGGRANSAVSPSPSSSCSPKPTQNEQ